MSATIVPFSTAITRLGLGYESTSGRVKASPFSEEPEPQTVVFHQPASYEDGPAQTAVQYKMNFIESRSDLDDKLSIGGKFSLNKANISGSVGGAYLDREIKSNEKVYLLVTCEVIHSVTSILGEPKMAPEGVPGNPRASSSLTQEKFLDLYGDSFVSAVIIGGRLDGLVEITASSEDDVTQIKADGQAEVKNVASGQISVDYVVSKLTQGRQAQVTCNGVGGGIGLSPMDAPSFVALARVFPIMVNGGEAETLKFEIQRREAEEGADAGEEAEQQDGDAEAAEPELAQVLRTDPVKFPGIAVPVRAVVRNYKGLPIFSNAETTLTRLSNYIMEDLLDYYLTYDNAKNTVADLMRNDNDLLSLGNLENLDDIRKDVRQSQVEILKEIFAIQALTDGIQVATNVVNYMAAILPGEYQLFKVNRVVSTAEREKEEQRLAILAQNARQALQQQQAIKGIKAFQTNKIEIKRNGAALQLFDDDSIMISAELGPGIRSLDPSRDPSVFPWKTEQGEQTLSQLSAFSSDQVWTQVREDGKQNARAFLLQRQKVLAGRLQRGEISMEVFLQALDDGRKELDESADEYTLQAMQGGDLSADADFIEGDSELYLAADGDGDIFRIDMVNAAQGLVRLRTQSGRFLRHKLQVLQYGSVVAEWLGDNADDQSFVFRIEPDGDTVTLQPDAGARGWKLYVLNDSGGTSRLLVGAPENAGDDAELGPRLQVYKFTIDLISAETLFL